MQCFARLKIKTPDMQVPLYNPSSCSLKQGIKVVLPAHLLVEGARRVADVAGQLRHRSWDRGGHCLLGRCCKDESCLRLRWRRGNILILKCMVICRRSFLDGRLKNAREYWGRRANIARGARNGEVGARCWRSLTRHDRRGLGDTVVVR